MHYAYLLLLLYYSVWVSLLGLLSRLGLLSLLINCMPICRLLHIVILHIGSLPALSIILFGLLLKFVYILFFIHIDVK